MPVISCWSLWQPPRPAAPTKSSQTRESPVLWRVEMEFLPKVQSVSTGGAWSHPSPARTWVPLGSSYQANIPSRVMGSRQPGFRSGCAPTTCATTGLPRTQLPHLESTASTFLFPNLWFCHSFTWNVLTGHGTLISPWGLGQEGQWRE